MDVFRSTIKEGENQIQEFKFSIDSWNKTARSLCAFANSIGGVLYVGINDKGKIVGCLAKEELQKIQSIAAEHCKPPINFESDIIEIEYKQVLKIVLQKSDVLHFAKDDDKKWFPYFRFGAHSVKESKLLKRARQLREKTEAYPKPSTIAIQIVLDAFENEKRLGLSQINRRAHLPMQEVQEIMAWLIVQNRIVVGFDEKGYYYAVGEC